MISRNLKFFLLIFLISLPFWWGINTFQKNLERFLSAQITKPVEEVVSQKLPERPKKPPLILETKSAISVKIKNDGQERIIFAKDIDKPLPIASLTKLMTALVALENYRLDDVFIISPQAAFQKNVPNFGNLDKEIGKKFTLEELLELMLVYSSNDAAYAIAEKMGVENFIEKMNQKAKELNLENTYFFNPHGLDPEIVSEDLKNINQSTAKDLVKIAQYILQNYPLIFEITKKEPSCFIENGIFNLFLTQKLIGGKTGYTKTAGGSILFIFKNQKGDIFINVILGADSKEARIKEMQKLIDWLNT
jgi:D-alanyl-D-alanine carboxypeptidase